MCPTSSKKWISEDFVFFDQKKLIKLNWIAIFLKKKKQNQKPPSCCSEYLFLSTDGLK